MIRAVVWDFGGVITTSPFDNFARYERENGLPRDFLRTINATDPDTNAWARFERSEVDLDAFDALFEAEARARGHPVPGREVIALLMGDLRPGMVTALERCAARLPCASITNNVAAGMGPTMSHTQDHADGIAAVMALFAHVVESSKVGLRKPDPRIYRLACEKLGVEPGEAAYLDDLGINLKPARALGMHTIKVTEPEAAIAELEAVVGFPLR